MAIPLNHAKRERLLRERQLKTGAAIITHVRPVPKRGSSRQGETVVLRQSRGPVFARCEILDVRTISKVSELREGELKNMPSGLDSVDALKKCGWTTGPLLEVLTLRVL